MRLTDKQKIEILREALDSLLDHYLSNRGTRHEFVACYTYDTGKIPPVIKKAKRALLVTQGSLASEPPQAKPEN